MKTQVLVELAEPIAVASLDERAERPADRADHQRHPHRVGHESGDEEQDRRREQGDQTSNLGLWIAAVAHRAPHPFDLCTVGGDDEHDGEQPRRCQRREQQVDADVTRDDDEHVSVGEHEQRPQESQRKQAQHAIRIDESVKQGTAVHTQPYPGYQSPVTTSPLTSVALGYRIFAWRFFVARLVVVDEGRTSYRVIKHLLGPDHHVDHYEHPALGVEYVRDHAPDVVFLHLEAGEPRALDLLGRLRTRAGDAPVVALLDRLELRSVVDAVQLGACDVVTHPIRMRDLQLAVTRALARQGLRAAPAAPTAMPEIVGASEVIVRLRSDVRRFAGNGGPVIVTGESGVGKELVARALHDRSPAASGRFEARNCGALPETLVEAELFGTERGAFTDAVTRPGAFELANGGTLFLDEIGELSTAAQVKLLRALETGVYYRVGGSTARRTTARIVVATNRNLRTLVEEGRFRDDLFYRIDVFRLFIPPLRDRREDVPLLAASFLHALREAGVQTRAQRFGTDALERLSAYAWPGNVRELRNVVWRALADARSETIGPEDLSFL